MTATQQLVCTHVMIVNLLIMHKAVGGFIFLLAAATYSVIISQAKLAYDVSVKRQGVSCSGHVTL